MKRFVFVGLVLSAIVAFFISCSTDFDINAPYKDTTVIYSLLNKDSSVHYFRISKAFLGEGSAFDYAKIPDSCLYPVGDIEVKLIEKTPSSVETEYLCRDTILRDVKDTGIFYAPDQQVYYLKKALNPDNKYKISVKKLKSGEVTFSEINVVNSFGIVKPYSPNNIIEFVSTGESKIEWLSAKYGKRYQPQFKFYYTEARYSNDTVTRVVTWDFGSLKSTTTTGGQTMSLGYLSDGFYSACLTQIPYQNPEQEANVRSRKALKVELNIYAIGQDLSTFFDVRSSGSIASVALYSNIEEGIGLFSSKATVQRFFDLGTLTQRNLNENPKYQDMKFVAIPLQGK